MPWSDLCRDDPKEARDDPESKGIKEGSHLEVPKSSTRAKLQKARSSVHLSCCFRR